MGSIERGINQESPEGYQDREKVASLIREAHEGPKVVDVIMESFGKDTPVSDVLVIEIQGDDLMLSYIAEDGDLGESIPVNINRIKRVDIIGPWAAPTE